MTITLTPDIETGLIERAQAQGKTPETLALERLREEFAAPADYRADLPPPQSEWERELRDIGIPCGVSLTDAQVSRDTLYDDHL